MTGFLFYSHIIWSIIDMVHILFPKRAPKLFLYVIIIVKIDLKYTVWLINLSRIAKHIISTLKHLKIVPNGSPLSNSVTKGESLYMFGTYILNILNVFWGSGVKKSMSIIWIVYEFVYYENLNQEYY